MQKIIPDADPKQVFVGTALTAISLNAKVVAYRHRGGRGLFILMRRGDNDYTFQHISSPTSGGKANSSTNIEDTIKLAMQEGQDVMLFDDLFAAVQAYNNGKI